MITNTGNILDFLLYKPDEGLIKLEKTEKVQNLIDIKKKISNK